MTRIGHRQLQQLKASLSQRDLQILVSLKDFRLMQVSQIRRFHFWDHASEESGARVCRRTMARLHGVGLVHRLERRVGGVRAGSSGSVFCLSPLGHRLLGTSRRVRHHEPCPGFVNHTLAITELAAQLSTRCRAKNLKLELQPEPAAWRTHTSGFGTSVLKPDLFVAVSDHRVELRWFVEIDLGTESRSVLERKCEAYQRYYESGAEQERFGVFPRVLWVLPDPARETAMTMVTSDFQPGLFQTVLSGLATGLLTDTGTTDNRTPTKGIPTNNKENHTDGETRPTTRRTP